MLHRSISVSVLVAVVSEIINRTMERIKDILYRLFINSGIVRRFMPLARMYAAWRWMHPENRNYLTVDEGGCTIHHTKFDGKSYPPFGVHSFAKIKHLRIRDNDVLICGYPKTGCHFTFEIVTMLLNKTTTLSENGKEFGGFLEILPEFMLDSLPGPRALNTHLLYDDLPLEIKEKKTKIVLTTRCPKDTVVSYYNHHFNLKKLYQYDGKFEDYFKLFMKGETDYGCYFEYVSDWRKVMTSHTTANPIFLLSYEELKSNPEEMIKKLARFLDVDVTDKFVEGISISTNFKNVKKATENDPIASVLYRKGIVGDWKNWLTDAQSAEMDARIDQLG